MQIQWEIISCSERTKKKKKQQRWKQMAEHWNNNKTFTFAKGQSRARGAPTKSIHSRALACRKSESSTDRTEKHSNCLNIWSWQLNETFLHNYIFKWFIYPQLNVNKNELNSKCSKIKTQVLAVTPCVSASIFPNAPGVLKLVSIFTEKPIAMRNR